MVQTLEQLKSGELRGVTRLTLRENLTYFPKEIFTLADTLEILDLSHNQLSELPLEMHKFKKLKIAFFSNNLFTEVPAVFKKCESLYMLGFKSNQITVFEENILPLSISWLILTDNKLKALPYSMGELKQLQKCALAGNLLENIPCSMASCTNLELLRLSANNLIEIPNWLLKLPKLSWLAFSGNPCSSNMKFSLKEVAYESLEIDRILGEGASGEIFKAYASTLKCDVALKLFKGAITSDGYATDEMNAYMSTGDHPNLIPVLAKLKEDESELGLLLQLIPDRYVNLGFPPDFQTCTRDTFAPTQKLTMDTIVTIAEGIRSASAHLHEKGLIHGDLYAHNILVNESAHAYLGDFGAASFYDRRNDLFEKVEVRAFACLIDDMLQLCEEKEDYRYVYFKELVQICMNPKVALRPKFKSIKLRNEDV